SYPGWWGQWLRWTVQSSPQIGLNLQVNVVADEAHVEIGALDRDGSPLRGLQLTASIRPRGGTSVGSRLSNSMWETAPGQYVARLPLGVGDWTVHAAPTGDAPQFVTPVSATVTHSFMAALNGDRPGERTLSMLTSITGGRRLAPTAEPFPGGRILELSFSPSWRSWFAAALIFWLLLLVSRY